MKRFITSISAETLKALCTAMGVTQRSAAASESRAPLRWRPSIGLEASQADGARLSEAAAGGSRPARRHLRLTRLPAVWVLISLLLPCIGNAQSIGLRSIPSTLLFSAGTTVRDAAGGDWAYLLWQAPAADLIAGKVIAVYSKPGNAAAASSFHREAIVQSSVDASVLGGILARAATLGMDLTALDASLAGIAQAAGLTVGTLPADRAVRMAAILRQAYTDPGLSAAVRGVSISQPALALCLGLAWTGQMPTGATMTYELREFNAVTNTDLAVIGRVTLTGGAPVALPAPGKPVQLPDATATGDLIIRLRWSTPDALRRRVFLHQGFNVYRVAWTLAQQMGWDMAAITPAQLLSSLAGGQTKKVNSVPLYTLTTLTEAQALDVLMDKTVHIADDNNRNANPNAPTPFADGAEFGYIIAPRDLLGRDGQASLAGYAQARRTLPPPVPTGLKVQAVREVVQGQGTEPKQFFRITWNQNASTASVPTTRYEVYRGTGSLLDTNGLPLATNLAVQRAHQNGAGTQTYDDVSFTGVEGQNYGIAVRAVFAGAGGDIASALSAPAFAVLTNETPPPAPYATVATQCVQPGVVFVDETTDTAPVPNDGLNRFRMACKRRDAGVDWAEFSVTIADGTVNQHTFDLGRFDFGADDDTVSVDFTLPTSYLNGTDTTVFVPVSGSSVAAAGPPGGNHTINAIPFSHLRFTSRTGNPFVVYSSPAEAPRDYRNDTLPLAGTHELNFLSGTVSASNLTPGDPISETFLARNYQTTLSSITVVDADSGLISGIADTPTLSYSGNYVVRIINGEMVGLGLGLTGGFVSLTFIDPTPGGPSTNASDYIVIPIQMQDCKRNVGVAAVDGLGKAVPVRVCVSSPQEAVEYRVFRRVDEGELVLFASGKVTPAFTQSCVTDFGIPVAGGRISYYSQVVGRNGATSAMAPTGTLTYSSKPPMPVLSPPRATGNVLLPTMKVTWTCPPEGVGRFELFINTSTGKTYSSLNASFSQLFVPTPVSYNTTKKFNTQSKTAVSEKLAEGLLTNRVGSPSMGAGPQFEMELPVLPNLKYQVSLRARSGAVVGGTTTQYDFTWKPPPTPVPDHSVPWPFRSLPEVAGSGTVKTLPSNGFELAWPNPDDGEQAGFEIGQIDLSDSDEFGALTDNSNRLVGFFYQTSIPSRITPGFDAYVHRRTGNSGPKMLPAVLYRRQEPSDAWPHVSGDVIQVSPLISHIAWENQDGGSTWVLKDPFIAATKNRAPFIGVPDFPLPVLSVGLFLLDTTPRVAEARYSYWLVCFSETTGEPECVIPTSQEVNQ